MKIATQDFHPEDHISFASNHPPPNNRPLESFIDLKNPAEGRGHETKSQRLWPVHCVQNTQGCSIIPEIDAEKIDLVVQKGMDPQVEMYSAFSDAFGNIDQEKGVSTDLAKTLHGKGITDVYVVGVAGDYCVRYTATGAARSGFKSYVIDEGTKSVDPGEGWKETTQAFNDQGVKLVHLDGEEVGWVRGNVRP